MKTIIYLIMIFTLISCGTNPSKVKESVKQKYPNAIRIEVISPAMYYLVVAKDSSLWIVNNRSFYRADKLYCDSLFKIK